MGIRESTWAGKRIPLLLYMRLNIGHFKATFERYGDYADVKWVKCQLVTYRM